MSKTLLTGALTLLACVAIAAQAPAPAPQRPARDAGQAPPAGSSAQSAPKTAANADAITIQGCMQRSPQASSATAGATGTAGVTGESFVLANAMRPAGASGSKPGGASPSLASSYRLDADAGKLTPHVGHKVEITGTVEASSATSTAAPGASAPAPRLKVDSVKMIAASCTP